MEEPTGLGASRTRSLCECTSGEATSNGLAASSPSSAADPRQDPLTLISTAPAVRYAPPEAVAESGGGAALARAVGQELLLATSPFPQRRATLVFLPYDQPCDGTEGGAAGAGSPPRPLGPGAAYVQPQPLPLPGCVCGVTHPRPEQSATTTTTNTATAVEGTGAGPLLRRLTAAVDSGGPYGRPLSFIFADEAVPFTAVLTTLWGAGMERVSGRAALLHKSWSLRWAKHARRSILLSPNLRTFQKVNHFPGTWRLERKDALHDQLRLAATRWHTSPRPADVQASSGGATRLAEDAVRFGWEALFPEGWVLPASADACQAALRAPENAGCVFIVKPAGSAGGRGMCLLRGGPEVEVPRSATATEALPRAGRRWQVGGTPPQQQQQPPQIYSSLLVQRYIEDPFLVLGRKFDLRLYVVVTSYEPCRFYLYREGLVRFAAAPYHCPGGVAPLNELTAHLTNFTVSKSFQQQQQQQPGDNEDDSGDAAAPMKWCLAALEAHVRGLRCTDGETPLVDWDATVDRLHDLLRKTFLAVTPEVRAELRELARGSEGVRGGPGTGGEPQDDGGESPPWTFQGISPFFEIYGVDVLLRVGDTRGSGAAAPRALAPVLMEVNIMPSLSTHYSPLDQCIKGNFVADCLTLVGLTTTTLRAPARGAPTTCGDAFVDSLTSPTAREACMTAEEERRRAPHFARLLPTAGAATAYEPLLKSLAEDPDRDCGHGSRMNPAGGLDHVLCDYESWRAARARGPHTPPHPPPLVRAD